MISPSSKEQTRTPSRPSTEARVRQTQAIISTSVNALRQRHHTFGVNIVASLLAEVLVLSDPEDSRSGSSLVDTITSASRLVRKSWPERKRWQRNPTRIPGVSARESR